MNLDTYFNELLFIIIWSFWSFVAGFWYRGYLLKKMAIEIIEVLKKREHTNTEFKFHFLKLDRVDEHTLLFYDAKTNEFVCQGTNYQDCAQSYQATHSSSIAIFFSSDTEQAHSFKDGKHELLPKNLVVRLPRE